MTTSVHGIHHVTCIAGDAQENLDFYVALLGMRLVKRSVNQDDPGTYHLFYADRVGTPGTDFTFFPWPQMEPGRLGVGLTVEVSFAVRPESLEYWQKAESTERIWIELRRCRKPFWGNDLAIPGSPRPAPGIRSNK
jgi:catechol 2,3-dioxygenase-like lactoylglutathione lyase family enzyme